MGLRDGTGGGIQGQRLGEGRERGELGARRGGAGDMTGETDDGNRRREGDIKGARGWVDTGTGSSECQKSDRIEIWE